MRDLYVISGTNRPQVAKDFTLSLIETSECGVVLVANPKIEIFNQLIAFKHSLPEGNWSRVTLYFSAYVVGFVQAVNYGWAKLREELGNDKNILAFLCSDDYEFEKGWYEAALNCYRKQFPDEDGLMFLRDITSPANRPKTGPAIVSAKFCDLYMGGWLAPPWYITSGIDTELVGLAEKHNKCGTCEQARIKHLLHDWVRTQESEQRKLAILTMRDRETRGWPYDIEAPWRHWK